MTGNKWTEEEIQILRELYPKTEISIKDIAKALGRSDISVMHKANHQNLERIPKRNINDEFLKQLRRQIVIA